MRRYYLEYNFDFMNKVAVDEHASLVHECLAEKGWRGVDKRDGGFVHYIRFKTEAEISLEGFKEKYKHLEFLCFKEEKGTTDTLSLSLPSDRDEVLRKLGLR